MDAIGVGKRLRARSGFSLVELLTTLGVLAVLVSLVIPAIQSSREAARKLDCQNRQRQVALAILNFEHSRGHLPAPLNGSPAPPAVPAVLSVFAHVLPELDQAVLFSRLTKDSTENAAGLYPGPPRLIRPEHNELLRTRLPVVTCPSDGAPDGGCNMRACDGVHPVPRKDPSAPEDGGRRGVFPARILLEPHRLSEVTDGLSNTVMLSERLAGDQDPARYSPHRDTYYIAPATAFITFESPDEIVTACIFQYRSPPLGEMSYGGAAWLIAGSAYTMYNHVLPPNSPINDCSANEYFLTQAAVTARSFHYRGVNAALADGSVRFVSESIDSRLWRALGTRAGGETGLEF